MEYNFILLLDGKYSKKRRQAVLYRVVGGRAGFTRISEYPISSSVVIRKQTSVGIRCRLSSKKAARFLNFFDSCHDFMRGLALFDILPVVLNKIFLALLFSKIRQFTENRTWKNDHDQIGNVKRSSIPKEVSSCYSCKLQ